MVPLGSATLGSADTWDQKRIPLTPDEARLRLRNGEPRIIFAGDFFITRNLENGEEVVVARRLREFFAREAIQGDQNA